MSEFWVLAVYFPAMVLVGQPVASALRRRLTAAGLETPARSFRDIGWGAALVPVTVGWLFSFGVFSIRTAGGSINLFGVSTQWESVMWSMVTVLAVAVYAVARPRVAGYLAAAGLIALGGWALYELVAFPHNFSMSYWWPAWLGCTVPKPLLALMTAACLVGGGELARRTIAADIRSRRAGPSVHMRPAGRPVTETPAVTVGSADLPRGVFSPALAGCDLGEALEALALDCPIATVTDVRLGGRLPAPVESAVYFAVAEALSNAVMYAGTATIRIRVEHTGDDEGGGVLRASVEDDGPGGVVPRDGGGLAAVERRLDPLGGVLTLSSPPGGPTTIIVEVPCALSPSLAASGMGSS